MPVVVTTIFRGIHTPGATPKHNLPLELKVETRFIRYNIRNLQLHH